MKKINFSKDGSLGSVQSRSLTRWKSYDKNYLVKIFSKDRSLGSVRSWSPIRWKPYDKNYLVENFSKNRILGSVRSWLLTRWKPYYKNFPRIEVGLSTGLVGSGLGLTRTQPN